MKLRSLRFLSPMVTLVLVAPLGVRAEESADDVLPRYRAALELEAAGDTARAAEAYAQVLRLDPEHLAARRALGYERVNGVWLAGEELKRAHALFLEPQGVLIARALRAPGGRVREAATLELKARALPGAQAAFTRALGSAETTTRVRAAEALGLLGDAAAIHALITSWEGHSGSGPRAHFAQTARTSYISDYDVEVA